MSDSWFHDLSRLDHLAHMPAKSEFMQVAPEIQIETLRRWTQEYGWPFTDRDFSHAASKVPNISAIHRDIRPSEVKYSPSESLSPVLVPYLPATDQRSSSARTWGALWAILQREREPDYADKSCYLALPDYEPAPGLRWEVIDFQCNVRTIDRSFWSRDLSFFSQYNHPLPHAAILAAAAYFPQWVRRLDGAQLPCVCLAGYQDSWYHEDKGYWVDSSYFLKWDSQRHIPNYFLLRHDWSWPSGIGNRYTIPIYDPYWVRALETQVGSFKGWCERPDKRT